MFTVCYQCFSFQCLPRLTSATRNFCLPMHLRHLFCTLATQRKPHCLFLEQTHIPLVCIAPVLHTHNNVDMQYTEHLPNIPPHPNGLKPGLYGCQSCGQRQSCQGGTGCDSLSSAVHPNTSFIIQWMQDYCENEACCLSLSLGTECAIRKLPRNTALV